MRQCTCDSEWSDGSKLYWMFRWYFNWMKSYMVGHVRYDEFSVNEYHIITFQWFTCDSLILAMRLKCHWRMLLQNCFHPCRGGDPCSNLVSWSVQDTGFSIFRIPYGEIKKPPCSKSRVGRQSLTKFFSCFWMMNIINFFLIFENNVFCRFARGQNIFFF